MSHSVHGQDRCSDGSLSDDVLSRLAVQATHRIPLCQGAHPIEAKVPTWCASQIVPLGLHFDSWRLTLPL